MIAKNILSNLLAPLRLKDKGDEAIQIMNVYHVKHLPVVEKEELISLISEDDILSNDMDAQIGSYPRSHIVISTMEDDHLFEVMQKMAANKLTVIPVVAKDNKYLGMITLEDILSFFGDSYSFKEPGSIILLETDKQNYSLGEVAQIAESENISIISSFVTSNPDTTLLYLTLKVNTFDIGKLINAYQRYDYNVLGTFTENEYVDILKERYDSLMHYLSI